MDRIGYFAKVAHQIQNLRGIVENFVDPWIFLPEAKVRSLWPEPIANPLSHTKLT